MARLAVLGPDVGRARDAVDVVAPREVLDHPHLAESVAVLVLDELLHRRRGAVEPGAQPHELVAHPLRLAGIQADHADVLPLLADLHEQGLAAVERLGVVLEYVDVLGGRDHDIEAGIGLGQAPGQLGRALDHQHLVIGLRLELGQDARQDVAGPLEPRDEQVLVGVVELLERLGVDHRGDPHLHRPGRDDQAGPEQRLEAGGRLDVGDDDLGLAPPGY